MKTINAKQKNPMLSLLRRYWFWLAGLAFLIILPQVFSSIFALTMLSEMGVAIIFALSYNMLLGQGGMLSFGHAICYGLGGYFAIHAMNLMTEGQLPIPLELLPLVGGLTGLLFGIIFGYISTKKAGTTFALISLGIVELVYACTLLLYSFFGGEEGIAGDRMVEFTLTGLEFGSKTEVYYLIAFWLIVSTTLMYLHTQTPHGRLANAVRDNPERTLFIGYNTHRVRFFQYALAGFFAGIAGGLLAVNYEIIDAESVGLIPSTQVLFMAYIGGIGHFFGPILGALLYSFLHITLANITQAWQLYLGIIFVAMVLWAPNGMAGLIMMHEPLWKTGRLRRLLPSYLLGLLTSLVLFFGIMVLIEINYHISLGREPDAPMNLLGVKFNVYTWQPWLITFAIIIAGALMFWPMAKRMGQKWRELTEEIKMGKKI